MHGALYKFNKKARMEVSFSRRRNLFHDIRPLNSIVVTARVTSSKLRLRGPLTSVAREPSVGVSKLTPLTLSGLLT
jgi:hypothetical protein